VRYYATWLETVHRKRRGSRNSIGEWESGDDDDEDDDEDTTDSDTTASGKKPRRTEQFDEENMLGYDLDDLTVHSKSRSGRSFPSIHFGEETSSKSILADDEDDEGEGSDTEEEGAQSPKAARPKPVPRILYIQMVSSELLYQSFMLKALQEFVDQQTLREVSCMVNVGPLFTILQRIIEHDITEEQAWTLFRQILDAVVHISGLGIVCIWYSRCFNTPTIDPYDRYTEISSPQTFS
jgi:translation initiation factor 2-alpha kinase 4